jgi:hypothetical protein
MLDKFGNLCSAAELLAIKGQDGRGNGRAWLHTLGPHPRPRHIAQTSVLFPVPFGPMTMFRFGPGKNSTDEYVTKFVSLTRMMAPGWYLGLDLVVPFAAACLPALDPGAGNRPTARACCDVGGGVSSSSRVRRERLVSLRPTEAGVPARDSSGSSSDSTGRGLRLGIDDIVAAQLATGAKR